jgi:hypothetical protein
MSPTVLSDRVLDCVLFSLSGVRILGPAAAASPLPALSSVLSVAPLASSTSAPSVSAKRTRRTRPHLSRCSNVGSVYSSTTRRTSLTSTWRRTSPGGRQGFLMCNCSRYVNLPMSDAKRIKEIDGSVS